MSIYNNVQIPGNPKIRICISAYLNANKKIINAAFSCVHSFLAQTYDNFELFIHHDGPVNDSSIANQFRSLSDKIVFFDDLPHRGNWGFYHRYNIANIEPMPEWIMWTNEDNWYAPNFLNSMLNKAIDENAGLVYTNMIHSHYNWATFNTNTRVGQIDMGAFIVKSDLVKETSWDDLVFHADGIYCEKIAQKTKCVKLENYQFIHN